MLRSTAPNDAAPIHACQPAGGPKLRAAGATVYAPTVGEPGDRYTRLVDSIHREFSGFRVVRKDRSRLHRLIHHALRIITFGRMTGYLDSYQTTIGRSVYVTADWDDLPADSRYVTMCHELIHLRQFRRYTPIGMALLYLLFPLPMGLAYFRARFEWEAYRETLRAAVEVYGIDHVRDAAYRESIVIQFTGPSYGWMWPFRRGVEGWYDAAVMALAASTGDADPDQEGNES